VAVAVVSDQPGREREDQRGVGELHDRIGPREADLRQAFERTPPFPWGVQKRVAGRVDRRAHGAFVIGLQATAKARLVPAR
jgi:hypothetical protein